MNCGDHPDISGAKGEPSGPPIDTPPSSCYYLCMSVVVPVDHWRPPPAAPTTNAAAYIAKGPWVLRMVFVGQASGVCCDVVNVHLPRSPDQIFGERVLSALPRSSSCIDSIRSSAVFIFATQRQGSDVNGRPPT